MKKLGILSIIPLMLLGAFLVPSVSHAAMTGLVSINGGTAVTATQTATTASVPVDISGSDAFNGFSIQIKANTAFLSGASVSLGTVLPNPTILSECINGVLIAGNSCPIQDQTGVVALAVVNNQGGSAAAGASGALFTITYNINGLTTGTPIGFNTGCTATSTGNSDCVFVQMASTTDSEIDQATTFSNLVDFTITPTFSALSTPGAAVSDVIKFASIGGYQDILDVSQVSTAGVTCTLSGTTGAVDLTTSTTGTDTLSCSGSATGSVTVTAKGEGIFTPPQPLRTHSATISVKVTAAGYKLSLTTTGQNNVTVSPGNTDSSTIVNLSGFGGFSGSVSFMVSSATGITGSAPGATLTNDGSGFSSATSTLTISVASSVGPNTYTLTVAGTGGVSASTLVIVPAKDFNVVANPDHQLIIRGASVGAIITINSIANFAGSATLTAAVSAVTGQQDSCCLNNNISPSLSSTTATLPAGGSVSLEFSASTVGPAFPTTQTATGNYTAVVSATILGVTRSTTIFFALYDFGIGPVFCGGNNLVHTSQSDFGSLDSPEFLNDTFSGIFIGPQCNTLAITDQPNVLPLFGGGAFFGPVPVGQYLYVRTDSFGGINTGLATNGFNGTPSIAATNPEIPFNGIGVPQIAVNFPTNGTFGFTWPSAACLLPTFWPNGTQIPYSYLQKNGPLIIPGTGVWAFLSTIFNRHHRPLVPPGALGNWGCRFDSAAFPNDAGVPPTPFEVANGCSPNPNLAQSDDCGNGVHELRSNNPDYFVITAMSIVGTLPGLYSFQFCGQAGVLRHCMTLHLNVLPSPQVHQLVYPPHTVSFSASGGLETFKMGITNPSTMFTIFVQATVTATGSFGDSLTATTAVLSIAPGAAANNIALSFPLTSSMIGETFTWSFSIAVGIDPVNLEGTSTEFTTGRAAGTFTVLS